MYPKLLLSGVVTGSVLGLAIVGVPDVAATAESSLASPTRSAWGESTTRVTVSSSERQTNNWTEFGSISANGRLVVFDGPVTNLDRHDTRPDYDVYLRDRRSGTTRLVSLGLGGAKGNSESRDAQISGGGRFVVFLSFAGNLTRDPVQRGLTSHVFVRDLRTRTNELITVAPNGQPATGGGAWDPEISTDGRYVTFEGFWSNLTRPRAQRNRNHVYFRDRRHDVTKLVSIGRHGRPANHVSMSAALSPGGHFVAFSSRATNLVARDHDKQWDVFIRNMRRGVTHLVSVGLGGRSGNHDSVEASVSRHGRLVAFRSRASDLVPHDTNGAADVFVRNMRTGVTRRVSVGPHGVQANGPSKYPPEVSANGRYVAFNSAANNLVRGDTNGRIDVFVRDRARQITRRVSVGPGSRQATGPSMLYDITPNGRHILFDSDSNNLARRDTNRRADIFVRSR